MPAWAKPDTEIPVVVDIAQPVARSAEATIALTGMRAYSTGFEFELCAVLRWAEDGPSLPTWPTHDPGADDVPDRFLRVGFQFSDGTSVTNLDDWLADLDPDGSHRPLLVSGGSQGSSRRYDARYWVWPLPPPGPVSFVVEWPARGIAEAHVEIDAGLIRDAAARTLDVWTGEPSIVDG